MEKKVILEEIGMYEDQPTHTLYETAMQTHFANHPLGRSVLGSTQSVSGLTSEQMRTYHDTRYAAGNIVLAVAGNFDWDEVQRLIEARCGAWPAGSPPRPTPLPAPRGGLHVVRRETSQQEHVIQMAPSPAGEDPMRFAAELLTVIVGDDTGSRFYWELVDPGFAESADLGSNEFDGTGAYFCYFTCPPEETVNNLERVRAIFDDVNKNGVTEAELSQARNKVLSRIVLRSERPMGRLGSLGHNWLSRQEYRSVEDDLQSIRSITREDVRRLLDRFPLTQLTTVAVGPLADVNWTPPH
jgi:predicted Zn-dependent peptidase